MTAFILAMTLHPSIQTRAQAELDAVVGPDRLPTMADRPRLPYVNALALEVLRSHVVAPTGVPHRVTEDDVYEGYFIPKGSLVLANLWCVVWERIEAMRALMREIGSCCTTSGRIVDPWSSGRRGSSRRRGTSPRRIRGAFALDLVSLGACNSLTSSLINLFLRPPYLSW